MKKYCLIIFLLLYSFLFSETEADIKSEEKRNIVKISNSFLKALKDKNKTEASIYLYRGNIKKLNPDEKKNLVSSFIKGETGETEYRTKIASHYAALFTAEPQERILVSYKIDSKIYKGKIEGKTEYYFLYAESKYDVLYNLEGENTMVPANVKIKLELIKKDNTYKISGFSL